jgi:hypothetical protein
MQMHLDRYIRNSHRTKMKRLLLPLSLTLLIVSAGCKSKPVTSANPLFGDWTSTTPSSAYGAAGCPTHYHFTETEQTLTTGGQDITIPVTYKVQPNLVTVVMKLGTNSFMFPTPDTAAWATGGCTYKRD